ncbi:hypothetical protein ASZ78_000061 [Callipepla squamata]|uniref:Transcriptional protein SWT1 n=1 Tax=Callipepla squamata TaxID=9009 RepID=A0A226ME60_CALSU|nr:hypothetical protein ASZ78_000061 [Callipepla squamata]
MSKKKLKKIKEYSLDGQDDKNSVDIRSHSQTVEREKEFQRFKTEAKGQEKKQYPSSNTGADGQSQGKSPNGSKITDNSLIKSEKRKRIVIQFKSKEIKRGRSTGAADIMTTSKENPNKDPFDGTESKRLCHSFVVQRHKVVKKKNKVELCKLKMQVVEDLHVARIEKRMAQSVVQTCGELTSMDIDLPEQDLNISAGTFSDLNILVVIDTNIMISHLEFVKSLKSEDIPGIGKLALIIPWVVLQELDNLKKGKMLLHVRQKAIPAVQFIYTCLKNQDSKLWGQSMQLASQKIYGLSDENNDDRVLQCCLQYQSLFPQAVVVLCTDDKNLCNKAIVCEVKALCKVDLVTALLNLNVNKDQNCLELQQSKRGKFVKSSVCYVHIRDLVISKLLQLLYFIAIGFTDTEFQKTKGSDAHLTSQFPNIIPDLEKNLGEALSCILETEMKVAYGNLWMEVVSYVIFLGKTLDTSGAVILLQETKKLLHAFSLRSDYDGILPRAYEKVHKLYEAFTEVRSDSEQNLSEDIVVLSKSSPCERMEETTSDLQNCVEKRLPSSIHVAQEKRHQEIWSVLEGLWNTVNLYRLEIFHKLESNTVIAKSSFEEAFSGLQELLAAVNYILEGIRR